MVSYIYIFFLSYIFYVMCVIPITSILRYYMNSCFGYTEKKLFRTHMQTQKIKTRHSLKVVHAAKLLHI